MSYIISAIFNMYLLVYCNNRLIVSTASMSPDEALGTRFGHWGWARPNLGLCSRIYIHHGQCPHTAFGQKTCLLSYLSLSQRYPAGSVLVTRISDEPLLCGLRAICPSYAVCLWLLLFLSRTYLEPRPQITTCVAAGSSKWLHDHLGILWDYQKQFDFGPGHIQSQQK